MRTAQQVRQVLSGLRSSTRDSAGPGQASKCPHSRHHHEAGFKLPANSRHVEPGHSEPEMSRPTSPDTRGSPERPSRRQCARRDMRQAVRTHACSPEPRKEPAVRDPAAIRSVTATLVLLCSRHVLDTCTHAAGSQRPRGAQLSNPMTGDAAGDRAHGASVSSPLGVTLH